MYIYICMYIYTQMFKCISSPVMSFYVPQASTVKHWHISPNPYVQVSFHFRNEPMLCRKPMVSGKCFMTRRVHGVNRVRPQT